MPSHIWWLSMSFLLLLVFPTTVVAAEPIDLNTAGMSQLMTLPGVGPRRAQEIIRHRLVHGFRRPADLMRIKGIGRRIYFKLKPLVRVGPVKLSRAEEVKSPVLAPAKIGADVRQQ
ncbi:MAG: helix-hairpin-helix domain-containing protein [Myxococcota bacterium]